jgi:hypothetical protein
MSGPSAERRGRERRTVGHRLEVILDVTRHLMSVTVAALKATWPKPGDEGMGTIRAAAELSERDRATVSAAS